VCNRQYGRRSVENYEENIVMVTGIIALLAIVLLEVTGLGLVGLWWNTSRKGWKSRQLAK
jgi:hypothetical protein